MSTIDTEKDASRTSYELPASLQNKLTIPLWPVAGQLLGLSKGSTYQAAQRGDFPGLLRIGHRWVVSVPALLHVLNKG